MSRIQGKRQDTLSSISETGTLVSESDEKPARHRTSSSQHIHSQSRKWKGDNRARHGNAWKDNPWKTCHRLTHRHDHNMVKAQTEEVQNLLIFASLFSAVVTSFAIDSYKFLQVDPEGKVPDLLNQILESLSNSTNEISSPASDPTVDRTFVRINIYWFISLSLSLITVLLGTTCMQWLREYKHLGSLSFKDALILRNLRYEGLIKWKVPFILSILPFLLQAALILFFAGIVELMWTLNFCVTVTIVASIGLAVIFMVVTAVAPAVQFLLEEGRESTSPAEPPCPYRSPQSWVCLQAAIRCKIAIQRIRKCPCWNFRSDKKKGLCDVFMQAESWFRYDLTWSRNLRTTEIHTRGVDIDLVHGLKWMAKTFAENMEAVQAVHQCVRQLDPITGLSVCSVLRNGDFTMVDEYAQSASSVICSGGEEIETIAQDHISATILEHFVTVSPQFESTLLPLRLELYSKSRAENLRVVVPGLPRLRCPDVGGNGAAELPIDLVVQYLLYVERLLLHEASLHNWGSYDEDIDAGWKLMCSVMHNYSSFDPRGAEILQTVSRFLRSNKVFITATNSPHLKNIIQRLYLDRVYDCLDTFLSFYNTLPETTAIESDGELKQAIELFVVCLCDYGTPYSHPLFQMPGWLEMAAKAKGRLPEIV
ncbi:hypothetical protein CPC08DRAFT_718824 [Agrocybe pediades]|nr:hypothetical protein CPC08DRAFT_718824 [Agrocybe pediades]